MSGRRYPFSKKDFPNCVRGHDYALDVVEGKITASKFVIGACKRYLRDVEDETKNWHFSADTAERYLRLVQKFHHVAGHWNTPYVIYEPWQCWVWMNIIGFLNRKTGFRRFRIAHVEIARGCGKQIPFSEVVPTPSGFKKWKEIEIGSQLFDRSGRVCTVIAKSQIRESEIHEVTFSDGSIVRCCQEHLWLTSTKSDRRRELHRKSFPPKRKNKHGELIASPLEKIRTTKEIMDSLLASGESNHSVKVAKPIPGKHVSEILPWYFVGYWLGNGSCGTGAVTCHEDDVEFLLNKFKSLGLDVSGVTRKKDSKGVKIKIIGVANKLRQLGILHKKSFDKSWIFMGLEQRLELLRGLLDSDGHAHTNSSVDFYSGILEIAEGVRQLACSLGYKATRVVNNIPENNNFKPTKTHYIVGFTPRGETKVFSMPRKLERHKEKVGGYSYHDKRYIVDVRPTGKFEKMFCVEVDSEDHTYLIGESFIPTHNSLMASQCALYMLCLDNPNGNQISTVATKKEQARIVLDASRAMADKNPSFKRSQGVAVLAHSIVHKNSHSTMRALSAEASSLDGLNDVLAVCDELHAMKRETFDVIYSGMSKRQDSLTLCITTAGFDVDSIGYSQSIYAKKVCLDEVEDDQFFAAVYCLDDENKWDDENEWIKANPNLGVSVDPVTLRAKVQKALETPSDIPNIKVKHMNLWLSQAEAFFDQTIWDKCADPSLKLENYTGRSCRAGLDLASHVDLTSEAFVFREKDGTYTIFDRTFIPEETVKQAKNVLYDDCIAKGFLLPTQGAAINYDRIREDMETMSRKLKIVECGYDAWNATEMAQKLSDRIDMVKVQMNVANFSEPMKKLDSLMREGKIRHNGSPLLRWCLGNVVAKEDHNGNVYPRKPHPKLKIDPIVAILMALALHLQDDTTESVYESRGVITI